jgi:ATP-dependent DNA ligase
MRGTTDWRTFSRSASARTGRRALPDSEQWLYELKLDGYRAIAFKRDGVVHLRSRNDNDFSGRYPGVVKGLSKREDKKAKDVIRE